MEKISGKLQGAVKASVDSPSIFNVASTDFLNIAGLNDQTFCATALDRKRAINETKLGQRTQRTETGRYVE